MVEPVISESCPYSRLQICICLAVLGVFFAINAHVGISDSSYTISVAASVIVFVILILMACFCAPLTFSTEFEADAKRKVIRFHATFLGCITWRSMCSTCKFQDVQVTIRAERISLTRAVAPSSCSLQDVVIKPAGRDKHRVELHLSSSFGGPETSRIIYVTDEVPAEDQPLCSLAHKSLCSWLSCCFGISEDSGDDANNTGPDAAHVASHAASVAEDDASHQSRKTRNVTLEAKLDAPLPPSYLIVETVNELKRVLESVVVQQKQSDYAVAKIAEISTGVQKPAAIARSLTKTGVLLPDMARPSGPNSIRPRLPTSLTSLTGVALPSDASSFADDSDLSPWGALTAFEGGGSERAMQGRLPPMHDRLSFEGGSLRGGSFTGNALAFTRAGSVSSVSNSVASESTRPVFHRRAPSAARNAPAAVAADPSLPGSFGAASVVRPVLFFAPAVTSAPPLVLQDPFFTPTAPLPSASTPRAMLPHAAAASPLRDVRTVSTHEAAAAAAAALPKVALARVQSRDVPAEHRATPPAIECSEQDAPQAPPFSGHFVPSSFSAASTSSEERTGASILAEAAAPLSKASHSSSNPRLLLQPHDEAPASVERQQEAGSVVTRVHQTEVSSNTAILERILSNMGASTLLSRFIDDYIDDGDLRALAVTKPAKLITKYGLNESQIADFVAGCRQADSTDHRTHQHHPSGDQMPRHDTSAVLLSAASVDSLVARPRGARALTALAADALAPRAPPPLPPLPSSFGT